MNRLTAVLLAAGVLLVHVLALYRGLDGTFGLPYAQAFVAFGLARNLVHEGALAWDTASGLGGLESYPSPLWIAVAWIPERLGWLVTLFAQVVGIGCTLFTVAVSTRFDTDRIAGVVPALLLVSCAPLAIAGPSGTEWPLFTALLCTAFVAQEKDRPRALAAALALLVATRPEGVLVAAVLAAQALTAGRAHLLPRYVPAVLVAGALQVAGADYARLIVAALAADGARAGAGLASLWDFIRATISPVLVVFPLAALALGELSGVGRRALALALGWLAVATLEGGGPWALQLAFVPALPPLFIAVEQGIARALDTYRPGMERLAWVAIAAVIVGSGLASRFPGDLGPLRLEGAYERWLAAAAEPPPGHVPRIARESLHHEIALTAEVRRIGLFVRDELPEGASVLTPWPGAMGYLARNPIIDLYGRTTPLGGAVTEPWWPTRPPALLLEALDEEPDFIVLGLAPGGAAGAGVPQPLLRAEQLADPAFEPAVRARLAAYELITCVSTHRTGGGLRTPVTLLRRRMPGTHPALHLAREGNDVIVTVTPPPVRPALLARLELRATRADGSSAWFAPDGSLRDGAARAARGTFELAPAVGAGMDLDLGRYAVPGDVVAVEAALVQPRAAEARSRVPLGARTSLAW